MLGGRNGNYITILSADAKSTWLTSGNDAFNWWLWGQNDVQWEKYQVCLTAVPATHCHTTLTRITRIRNSVWNGRGLTHHPPQQNQNHSQKPDAGTHRRAGDVLPRTSKGPAFFISAVFQIMKFLSGTAPLFLLYQNGSESMQRHHENPIATNRTVYS